MSRNGSISGKGSITYYQYAIEAQKVAQLFTFHYSFSEQIEPILDGNRFKCPYCPSTFSHKFNVPRHIKSHHEGLQQTDVEIKEEKADLKGLYTNHIGLFQRKKARKILPLICLHKTFINHIEKRVQKRKK